MRLGRLGVICRIRGFCIRRQLGGGRRVQGRPPQCPAAARYPARHQRQRTPVGHPQCQRLVLAASGYGSLHGTAGGGIQPPQRRCQQLPRLAAQQPVRRAVAKAQAAACIHQQQQLVHAVEQSGELGIRWQRGGPGQQGHASQFSGGVGPIPQTERPAGAAALCWRYSARPTAAHQDVLGGGQAIISHSIIFCTGKLLSPLGLHT